MPKEMHHPEHLGNDSSGVWKATFAVYISLALIILGALLAIFMGGFYSLIFGVPLVILGLLLIVVIQFFVAKKGD